MALTDAPIVQVLSADSSRVREAYGGKDRDVVLLDWLAACEAAGRVVPIKARWYLCMSKATRRRLGVTIVRVLGGCVLRHNAPLVILHHPYIDICTTRLLFRISQHDR